MASAVDTRVVWRAARPAAIEDELMTLWADVGREQAVTRAMMSNLVVLKARPATRDLDLSAPVADLPLDDVARRHPARILLVYHVPGAPAHCPPLAAAVAVTIFGPAAARYGVETIAVESMCAQPSLPSIVRRLMIGDLPTTLWWADDLSHDAPVPGLASMARQVLYDSRQFRDLRAGFAAAARLLAVDRPPDIADLNWRRLTAMRSAVASMVRARDDVLNATFRARIEHRPGDGALAQLLAGWIAGCMKWPADRWSVSIEEKRHGDEVLQLLLEDGRTTVLAVQNGRRVLVRDGRVPVPITMPTPHETTADAIAMELASLTPDACLHTAVRALAAHG
jgi:glucose-6-phosphate dehydrogenase assembly protein OpcA